MILFCSKSWKDRIYLLLLRRYFDEKAQNISLLLINICVIMKKIFTFAIMFAAVAMVACGGQTKKTEAVEAEAEVVEVAEVAEEACCEECAEACCEECTEACAEAEAPAETVAEVAE